MSSKSKLASKPKQQPKKSPMPRGSRPTVKQPVVTGDCEQRWERASGSVAATKWFNIAGGTVGVDGTPTTASIMSEFHFDGGTDKVDTTYEGAAKDADNDWSCVVWLIRDSSDVGQVTLAQNRRTVPSNGGMLLGRDNDAASYSVCTFQVYNPGYASVADSVPAYTDEKWHMLVITWDADGGAGGLPGRVAVYLDGAATSTTASTLWEDGTNWIVGGGTYNRWTGYIDTFRVYPRVLSADEIKRDYQAGIAGHQARVAEENLISQYVPTGMTTTAWTDVTGSNNMTGAVTAPPAFDGDDYYTIGNPANLQFTNNWSVEAWASQSDAAPAGSFERLISKDDIGANRCFILSQKDSNGFPFAGIFVGGSLKSVTGTHDYADNNWHHYMVTHDGTNLILYVDGALEGSVATGGAMDNDPANWEIGRAQDGSAYLEGRVDTVRFYNATLSLAQAKQNYLNGLAAHS
jgi:hypothetical protein